MKVLRKIIVTLCCAVFLLGCATVIEGESQDVTINTTPSGANCTVVRNGTSLGVVPSTPGNLHVEKTKDDISIKCIKHGYRDATYLDKSGYPEYNWAYIIVGGPIGWGFDSATGADNQYTSPVSINFVKQ